MNTPPIPAPFTPRDELHRRAAALRQHLRTAELDAALITQNVDLLYFGGSIQSGVLIVPADGEPVYAVRRVLERARAESALETIVPFTSLRKLGPLVAEALGRPAARIGTELDVLPVAVRDRFAASLGTAEFTDVSAAVRRIRSVKSPFELDKMRAAARLSDAILRTATEALRDGMTELELSAQIEAEARRRGHEGVIRLRGWNQETYYGMIAAGPVTRVIEHHLDRAVEEGAIPRQDTTLAAQAWLGTLNEVITQWLTGGTGRLVGRLPALRSLLLRSIGAEASANSPGDARTSDTTERLKKKRRLHGSI